MPERSEKDWEARFSPKPAYSSRNVLRLVATILGIAWLAGLVIIVLGIRAVDSDSAVGRRTVTPYEWAALVCAVLIGLALIGFGFKRSSRK